MWAIQLPTGEYLELSAAFQLAFEQNNQVFSTSSSDVLPGAFTFPVEIALSPANRRSLSIPQRVDNQRAWAPIEEVRVYAYGKMLFLGTLKINSTTDTSARVTIVANPMAKLKQIELPDLALGGARTWSGDFLDHMADTANFPDNYDYVFFPVWNANQNGFGDLVGDPDNFQHNFQNYYDLTAEAFDDGSAALTPFVRLDYLLDQIFQAEDTGFTFVNGFQLALETKRLYVYNNVDSRVLAGGTPAPALPSELDLKLHVPKVKSTEFLKSVMAQFGLGLFTNIFNRTLRLVPMQAILRRPARHDWTAYRLYGTQIEESDDVPDGYNYEQAVELPPGVPTATDLQLFLSVVDFTDARPTLPAGYYYIEALLLIVELKYIGLVNVITRAWQYHRGVYFGNDNPRISDMGLHAELADGNDMYDSMVQVSRFHEVVEVSGTTYEFRYEDYPVALMLYRGMQEQNTGENRFPLACNHVYLTKKTGGERSWITIFDTPVTQSEISLNWFGEYGLYNTWHRLWDTMLRTGKPVTFSFSLPIDLLIEFAFDEKIRVDNMEYLVKRLRVKRLLGAGRIEVEAQLFSVI